MTLSDSIAIIGVGLLLLAFLLQSAKVIGSHSYTYLSLNLCGAAIAGYAAWLVRFYPFVVLEGVWVIVAGFNLIKLYKTRLVSRETNRQETKKQ